MSRIVPAAMLDDAVRLLREGQVVAFPTETVYGLGALALDAAALARIFALKGRPATHPLIAHVRDAAEAATLTTDWDARAQALADKLWPGPLTLVVPRAASVPAELSGGKPTVAVRAPAHPVARELLARVGQPLAAPSANRYQSLSPTTAQHVARAFADEELLVVDGGACQAGVESTVLDLTVSPPAVLRPGPLTLAALRAIVPDVVVATGVVTDEAARHSPGQDALHYAPRAPLRVLSRDEAIAAARAASGPVGLVLRKAATSLPPTVKAHALGENAEQYAHLLYATLHSLDDAAVGAIYVESPPDDEAWMAVGDRLRRAAAK